MARWVDVRGIFRRLLSDFRIRIPQLPIPAALPRGLRRLRQIRTGFRNALFLERCAAWELPYWAGRQENPADEVFIPRAQSSLAYNQTNRNWTVAGVAPGPIVDPRGMITPFRGGWSVDFWLDINGKLYTPMQAETLKQYLGDPVPEVHTIWQAGPMNVRTSVVTFKTGSFPWLGCTVTLTGNLGAEPPPEYEDVRLLMVIRPYNPEGFAPLKFVKYTMDGFMINGQLILLTTEFPDRAVCSDGTRGDGARLIDGPQIYYAESPAGLANAVAAFNFGGNGGGTEEGVAKAHSDERMQSEEQARPEERVRPEERTRPDAQASTTHSKTLEVFVPLGQVKKGYRPAAVSRQVFLSDLRHEWQARRSKAMQVTLPDQRLSEAVKANLAYALTFADNKSAGGRGIGNWGGTEDAYLDEQLMMERSAERAILAATLDGWGLHQEAEKVIEQMLGIVHHQPNRIVHGNLAQVEQAIWALQKHSALTATGNDAMLKSAYDHVALFFPALRRFDASSKGRVRSHRGKTRNVSPIMPPLRKYWNSVALRDATLLAQRFGKPETADGLRQVYAAAHARIVEDFPQGGGRVADLMAIDPLELITPDQGGLPANLDLLENVLYYNPRMSGYDLAAGFLITQCLIRMRESRAYAALEQLLAMALPTYAWPRAVHPRTGGGSFGEGHDPLVTALFLWVIRSILIREESDSLILGASFPAQWYEPGTVITVDNAPTSFGNLGYRITADAGKVELQLQGEYRYPPQTLRWEVPFTIKSAVVNDREALHREHSIILLPQTRKVVLNRE